jgi:DNA excision repair protein ERCC-2
MSETSGAAESGGDEQGDDQSVAGATAHALTDVFFPFEQPYPQQAQGINTAVDVGQDNGLTLIEGACGTGKTLLSLTSALALVRDPRSSFEQVMVLTSVKQQLRAFEDDLRTINDHLPSSTEAVSEPVTPPQIEPVTATTLVGKADICPYVASGAIDRDDIYRRCSDLRGNTRGIVNGEGSAPRVTRAVDITDAGREASAEWVDSASDGEADHTVDVEEAAYGPAVPEYGDTEVCPYYGQTMADDIQDLESIDTDGEVLSPDRLTEKAVQYGVCPHTSMQRSVTDAEVVIGNYSHAFDRETVKVLTHRLLDESTFIICDEAHMLVERVRDQLSYNVSLDEFSYAVRDAAAVADALGGHTSGPAAESARETFRDTGFDRGSVQAFQSLLARVQEALAARVDVYDRREVDGPLDSGAAGDEAHIPLGDPETTQTDDLTEWLVENAIEDWLLESAGEIGELVASAVSEFPDHGGSGRSSAGTIGGLLTSWYYAGNHEYFREIELYDRKYDSQKTPVGDVDRSWRQAYVAEVRLDNCIPASEIANRLSDFGGGILMSATLSPLDMYVREAGIQYLSRRVEREVFGLTFPDENRESLVVPAQKFNYENRGGTPSSENATDLGAMTDTRQTYAAILRMVATTTPGNVLVAMPNYGEAAWAGDYLDQHDTVSKPVLVDGRTTNKETDQLKATFFDGESKVLTTSLRGTLTEGVDYAGDRLSAAVVCGVPMLPSHKPPMQARQASYDREFGAGHPFAFAVPAVRKARQAFGRVIRGADEVGVRVLADQRYAKTSQGGVQHFFPDHETEEFDVVPTGGLADRLESFWAQQ